MTDQSSIRKASEVLIELEEKVDKLTAVVGLYDFNLKNILNKVNQTHILVMQILNTMPLSEAQKLQLQKQLEPTKNHEAIEIPQGTLIDVESEPKGHRRSSRPESYTGQSTSFQEYQEPKKVNAVKSDKKIPVIGRIKDDQNRDVFLSEVSFLTPDNKTLIVKCKSSAVGKYQALLSPGKYSMHVVKVDASTKRKLETNQIIEVPVSDSPVELPVCVLQR